jgi:hypothetical protein
LCANTQFGRENERASTDVAGRRDPAKWMGMGEGILCDLSNLSSHPRR